MKDWFNNIFGYDVDLFFCVWGEEYNVWVIIKIVRVGVFKMFVVIVVLWLNFNVFEDGVEDVLLLLVVDFDDDGLFWEGFMIFNFFVFFIWFGIVFEDMMFMFL